MNRFTRQIRLAEVGEAGQAKLTAARIEPRTQGFARTVEAMYLRAAGVGGEGVAPREGAEGEATVARAGAEGDAAAARTGGAGASPRGLGLQHAAPREVAEGAYAALVAMRRILGVESSVGASGGGAA